MRFDVTKLEVLDKAPVRDGKPFEVAGWSDKDLMYIRAVAVREGVNLNGARFERDDLERASDGFSGKPIRILFDNNNPTGHGYDRTTNTFSELVKDIGVIEWSYGYINPDDDTYEIEVFGVIWQKYHPEIAMRLRQLHRDNNLKFSFEAILDYEVMSDSTRRCFNINFTGLTVVENPAEPKAKSVMVAELLKEGGYIMEEQLKKALEELASVKTELATAKKEAEEVASLREEVANLNGTVKTLTAEKEALTAERDTLKSAAEQAEVAKKGEERKAKLAKFGEVAETAEDLGKLTAEEFVTKLEAAVENYKPTATTENAGVIATIPVNTSLNGDKPDRKEVLFRLFEGVGR